MYARLLAMLGLLCVSTLLGWSESAVPPSSELDVYLNGEIRSPDVRSEMKRELAALMQRAGFRVVWRRAHDKTPSSRAVDLIVVELRGACALPTGEDSTGLADSHLALASSSVVDAKVLPFSWVDCSALNRFLGPTILNLSEGEQAYLYGRAMARLLAHEFYHVLAQTEDHTEIGISKARLSTADLLSEHLGFGAIALEKLRGTSPVSSADDGSVGGR